MLGIARRTVKDRVLGELWYDLHHLRHRARYREVRAGLPDLTETRSIFVHVPKTAGCSIGHSLYRGGWGGHRTIREYRQIFGRRFWRYFRFTFVRDPWRRLVSAYDFLAKGGHPKWRSDARFAREVLSTYDGFDDFVLRWVRPDHPRWPMPHFATQVTFLDLDGALPFDFVGRVEDIEADFATVAERIGVEATLREDNRTPGKRPPLASWYTNDAVVRHVQQVYAEDFERLGYAAAPPA